MRIYLQIYMAVFFITGRALRGSALFLFPDQKTTCWKRTRKTWKDVVTYYYRNRSWILCHQNSPCVFPDWTDRVRLWAVYHAKCPAVQWEILCVWNWAADAGEKQDFQWQLLSFDNGSHCTGDPLPPGREENRCGSGSRPPTGKFWQGEKRFPGISVSGKSSLCVSGTRMRAMRSGFRM